MTITVRYTAQLRSAAGTPAEKLELPEGSAVADAIRAIAQRHGDAMRNLVLLTDDTPHPSILVFRNDEQVTEPADVALTDFDTLSLLSPISGG